MKPSEIYGVRKTCFLLLGGSLLSFLGTGALIACGIATGMNWVYYSAGLLGAFSLYVLYQALYQGVFRYRTLVKVSGIDVEAVITHFDSHGNVSMFVLAEAFIGGKIVEGRLYGTFDDDFRYHYDDGTKIRARYLASGEFLLYQKQPQNIKK
jgi:hypothetical protein